MKAVFHVLHVRGSITLQVLMATINAPSSSNQAPTSAAPLIPACLAMLMTTVSSSPWKKHSKLTPSGTDSVQGIQC
jgi:hypothetical protein